MERKASSMRGAVVVGVVLAACGAWMASRPHRAPVESGVRSSLPRVEVIIAGRPFTLEVAATEEAIDRGLGGRAGLAPGTGMLFVFPESGPQGFVMRDCPFALDIVFLDDAGLVISTASMKPERPRRVGESIEEYDAQLHIYFCTQPCRFAIEISEGDVALDDAVAGQKIALPLSVRAAS